MKVGLPTIMHTGNHLAQQHIFKSLGVGTLEGIQSESGDLLITYHVIDEVMDRWWKALDHCDHIYTVMRHPARVMESFRRRGRSLKQGDRKYDEGCNFESQWKNLIKINDRYPLSFIHIDSPSRDEQVWRASKLLGVPLGMEWPVLGERQGTKDMEITEEHINQVPHWIMDFYNEIARRY